MVASHCLLINVILISVVCTWSQKITKKGPTCGRNDGPPCSCQCMAKPGCEPVPEVDYMTHAENGTSVGSKANYTCVPGFVGEGDVRIVGGKRTGEGRVEVLKYDIWGTVCHDSWDKNDAKVVCQKLDFEVAIPVTNAYYGQGADPIWLDDVSCRQTEPSLTYCSHRGWGVHNCHHGEDAGVICGNDISIRLNGSEPYRGLVEFSIDGEWGTIASTSWTSYNAKVVCRLLGFDEGHAVVPTYVGDDSERVWLNHVYCQGYEKSLFECGTYEFQGTEDHNNDVGVYCGNDTDIRLGNGSAPHKGRVEVYIDGAWGTVTDSYFTNKEAKLICGMFGYDAGFPVAAAYLEQNAEPILPVLFSSLYCPGSEKSIFDCRYYSRRGDSHSYDVGVYCGNDTGIRMVNGSASNKGRIEVSFDGEWGTIGSYYWGSQDAKVVCKMFGFDGGFPVVWSYFGEGTGPIWLSDVSCGGQEISLFECPYTIQRKLGHSTDAGVYCGNETDMRLVNGEGINEGRVEVSFAGEWGTVSYNNWDSYDAKVVCKMLGFDIGLPIGNTYFEEGTGPVWLDNVGCGSAETNLFDCNYYFYGGMRSHYHDVGVTCANVSDIRLMNGSSSKEGRVEISLDGVWGTFCNYYFPAAAAKVVCRMLGLEGGIAVSGESSIYGEGVGRIWSSYISCSGSEESLLDCRFHLHGQSSCDHSRDVGVICN
ncbi:hypothetical protein ScPMuIL_007653 [Solemya velum]